MKPGRGVGGNLDLMGFALLFLNMGMGAYSGLFTVVSYVLPAEALWSERASWNEPCLIPTSLAETTGIAGLGLSGFQNTVTQ